MTQLIVLVCLYMLVSVGIGLWAARRVRNTADYALAGRSLPLMMVITATFATWFGSETVLGLPGRFIEGGIAGVIEEPFGSGMALVLVGMFFARKLYKMNLLTISDFYRRRYGRKIELACSIFIIISYLGWVGAQIAALGLVLNLVTEGFVSVSAGMTIGTFVVLFYTVYGGMWSVAVTDFFQMIIIVAGLVAVAVCAGTAARGAALGGIFYIFFAFVPMFIVCAAVLAMPGVGEMLLNTDPQRLLPTLVRDYMPGWLRVIFFGAVLSAVMSTASATMLAPSTTFVKNVLADFIRITPDRQLFYMRATLFVFAVAVLTYSLWFEGTAIYDMVAMAYQFPVVGAFWPLVCGIYWKRATTQGAWLSIVSGAVVWVILTATPAGSVFPSVLGGFMAAGVGMVAGSLMPTRSNARYRRWQAVTAAV